MYMYIYIYICRDIYIYICIFHVNMTGKRNRLWDMGHPQPLPSPRTKVSKYMHPTFSSKGSLKTNSVFVHD